MEFCESQGQAGESSCRLWLCLMAKSSPHYLPAHHNSPFFPHIQISCIHNCLDVWSVDSLQVLTSVSFVLTQIDGRQSDSRELLIFSIAPRSISGPLLGFNQFNVAFSPKTENYVCLQKRPLEHTWYVNHIWNKQNVSPRCSSLKWWWCIFPKSPVFTWESGGGWWGLSELSKVGPL